MDRATYEQIDRLEAKIDFLNTKLMQELNFEIEDCVLSFYEEEVLSDKGSLKHLREDRVLKEFMERLENKDESEEEKETEDIIEDDEYRQ